MWIRALLWLPLLFENVLADDYFSIGAHLSADALSRALRGTVNDLLQIPRAQNNITIPVFQKVDLKPQAFLDELAEQLDERFLDIKQQLANIAKKVTVKSKKDDNSCGQLVNSFLFPTSASNCCPTVEGEADFEVDRNATTLLLRNPAVQSLFIYNSNQLSECPPRRSSTDRAQHWRQILSGLHQGVRRDVVIAIDMNDLHTDAELQQVKTTAKALLDVALAGDRYSIVANSNNGLETHCSSSISHLQEIVKNLRIPEEGKVRSSHPELMKAATDVWKANNNTKHIIHYISRGILSEMSEAMKTLEVHNLVLYANAAAALHVYLLTEEGKVVASSRKSEIGTLKLNELDLWTSPDGTLPFTVPRAKHGVFTMPTPSGKRRYLWKTLKSGLIFAPLARRLDPTEQLVNNYWVYLNDRIGVIRSSAIKSGVREEAGMMGAIAKLWIEAGYDPVVIRRFIASRRGLLVSYPAVVLDESLDPRSQLWFQKALKNPKRLAITGPIADPLLGDTVVLSTALSYGQQDMFVVGVEVTLNFLEHVVQRTVSACSEGRRCLLLTSIGNVVALPTELLHTLSVDAVERYHLAHVDPTLTSHLLTAPHIFRKEECRSTSGQTHHRFRFNTSYSRVDTKMCSSLPPLSRPQVQSEVVLVPHTNVFLALINTSCVRRKEAGHFCPCSVSDRRCLFCARFDENECECPCQCGPNRASACDTGPKDVHKTTTLCTPDTVPYPPNYAKAPHYLEECQPSSCPQFHSPSSCNLRPGSNGLDASRDAQNTPSTPVSLIGALVGSVIIGLAIAIFTCYRNRSNRLRERRICNSDQGGTLFCGRFGTLEPNEDFYFDHEGLSREKLILASFERSGGGPPSPRPAPRGPPTVSDLGYSTMTERTNEGSDAGTSSNLPGIRIRVTDV
ncbi:unnamed protein product, partial [Mesorhabditis spiculigera]